MEVDVKFVAPDDVFLLANRGDTLRIEARVWLGELHLLLHVPLILVYVKACQILFTLSNIARLSLPNHCICLWVTLVLDCIRIFLWRQLFLEHLFLGILNEALATTLIVARRRVKDVAVVRDVKLLEALAIDTPTLQVCTPL